jgi:hypothetical protein
VPFSRSSKVSHAPAVVAARSASSRASRCDGAMARFA